MSVRNTYLVRLPACNSEFSGYGDFCSALWGIKNATDYDVEVVRVYIENGQGWDATQSANPVSVWRTSSCTATTGIDLVQAKMDTGSAALPAQVTVKRHADVITTSLVNHPGQMAGQRHGTSASTPFLGGRMTPSAYLSLLNGTPRTAGFVQPIVLREGQGVALVQDSPISRPRVQHAYVLFRNQATGETYHAMSHNIPSANQDVMLSVFNGTGSGVILEILKIYSSDVGFVIMNSSDLDGVTGASQQGSQAPSSYRLVQVRDITDGEAIAPVSMDTANALPAGISFIQGGYAVPLSHAASNFTDVLEESISIIDTTQIVSLQRQNVLRAFFSHVQEGWQVGTSNFPHRWIGGYQRGLLRRPNVDGAGFFVKKGTCLAMLYEFRSTTPSTMQVSPWSNPDLSVDAIISTLTTFNMVIEFTVSVGSGTPVTGVPTAAGSFIS